VIGIEKKINWKKLNIRNIQNYKQEVSASQPQKPKEVVMAIYV
jgi:hypothetical protein